MVNRIIGIKSGVQDLNPRLTTMWLLLCRTELTPNTVAHLLLYCVNQRGCFGVIQKLIGISVFCAVLYDTILLYPHGHCGHFENLFQLI